MNGKLSKPIFIIGAPRSGTTFLFRILASHPDLWHLSAESHFIFEGPFHPKHMGYNSNRFNDKKVNEIIDKYGERIKKDFYRNAINFNIFFKNPTTLFFSDEVIPRLKYKFLSSLLKTNLNKPKDIRLLEKTPKNSLRINVLNKLFPDAYYIWIIRDPIDNIISLIKGWKAQEKIFFYKREKFLKSAYYLPELNLTDYSSKMWKFVLIPNWRDLANKNLLNVAIWQYYYCLYYPYMDFKKHNLNLLVINIDSLNFNLEKSLLKILQFLNLDPNPILEATGTFKKINVTSVKLNTDISDIKKNIKDSNIFDLLEEIKNLFPII